MTGAPDVLSGSWAGIGLVLISAVAGGAGAVVRFVVDALVASVSLRRARRLEREPSLPWGTLAVNLTGAFFAGLAAAGAASVSDEIAPWTWVIAIGFLGGYTTFSTASVDLLRLLVRGQAARGVLVVGIGQLLASVLAAGLGWWLGAG